MELPPPPQYLSLLDQPPDDGAALAAAEGAADARYQARPALRRPRERAHAARPRVVTVNR